MTAKLSDAVALSVRYELPDEKGETRRQRNAKFGVASPDIEVPDEGQHVWDWFWEKLTNRRKSGPEALTHAEIGEWQRLTRTQVLPEEIEMLIAMDDAYMKAYRDEQEAQRAAAADRNRK